ncbi:MAG: phosphate acyltransferase PlsX [Rhodothermales bacterium]|nr:phosphate acyltransferase PlsX [Rhodothermales bacterium]
MAIRVAVDAMGGDRAPGVVLEGALLALDEAPPGLELQLFGPEAALREALGDRPLPAAARIVDAPEVIGMAEAPAKALKGKPNSSIHRALAAHKEGHADAFVTAGNTGAAMAAAFFILGRLPGVARPSLVGFFPTTEGLCFVLDVGSNVDCRAEHLVQFAQMGAVYVQRMRKVERPVVALLNIGEEPGKGNELTKETYDLLVQQPGLHFRGNVEGRDVMHHAADVIVCDGFVGNVMLKYGESVATAVMEMVHQEMDRHELSAPQVEAIRRVLGGVRQRFNPETYGGAPLLGVDGNVVIGHGSSTPRAIARMILVGAEAAEQDLARSIAEALHA